jgi:nitroreductase/NAD-dependent dihydropyrimidine dehydrogenase PreA subunit
MKILGVNAQTCTHCTACVQECPNALYTETSNKEIIYQDPEFSCNGCGHCIAICPSNSILHDNPENVESFPNINQPELLITYPSLLQAFRAKRSIRRYKPEPVAIDILEKVFSAMRYAPSASNLRGWKYTILSDPEKIRLLGEGIEKDLINHPMLGASYGKKISQRKARGLDPIFFRAPHLVILSASEMEMEGVNTGIALTYGMLAAQALGLGTCWIGLAQLTINANKNLKKIAGVLGKVWGVITIGYPNVRYHNTPPRAPLKLKFV